MALATTSLNYILDQLVAGGKVGYASLHTGFPATAANELTATGSPAYARKAVTWGAAAGGVLTMNGTDPVFDVPAGATVEAVAFCSSGTRGTSDINADYDVTTETFGSQGTYTITDATITIS